MPKLTFYPLGNADCSLIELADGQKILVDYADVADKDDDNDKRIDLESVLSKDIDSAQRDNYDVVVFTHLDKDHICGSSEFFWLDHDKKYQRRDRIKIDELWVPAAAITDDELEDEEAKIIQAEAQYRLKEGKGIRVFSRPERLKEWLENKGLSLDSRKHLITDAGKLVPGYVKENDEGVEFFIHSPFAKRTDDEIEDRNSSSIVFQATFLNDDTETKAIFSADIDHEIWADIVDITKNKNNEERLEWDMYKLPHHCSYLSIGPDKGKDKTKPVEQVKWLCEEQGQNRSFIISSSKPIPLKGSKEDEDSLPPHRQAANYYKAVCSDHDGDFIVTMENPKISEPKPTVIIIDNKGAKLKKEYSSGGPAIVSQSAPRAGKGVYE